MNESEAWALSKQVTSQRKSGDAEGAVNVAREGLQLLPDFEPLQSALCWALYERDIKSLTEEPTLEELRKGYATCREIRTLLANDLYGDFSTWVHAVLRISKDMLAHQGGDRSRIVKCARDMLAEVDPDKLSKTGYQGGPSPFERHALSFTKALNISKEWSKARQACTAALPLIPKGGDTESWIRHRLGLALLELGEPSLAAEHISFILSKKPTEWWALRNDGRVKIATGDTQGAIRAFASALKGGALHMKTQAMIELAHLLRSQGNMADADLHHLVARQIRLDQGWPSTSEIDQPIKPDQQANSEDKQKLKELWDTLTPEVRECGKIHKVFENGGAGFIQLDNGTSLYFSMAMGTPAPPEGTVISCRIVDSFDKKKQQTSKKAIDVKLQATV